MTLRKSNPYLTLVNSYLIDSPQPSSINYWWNLGSLLGLCLVIQIASGIFLAMHYSSNIELAFNSVEHIMRDVNAGWLIRYIHANGASFFFICLYLHIAKALYYGSYKSPRVLVWTVGVIIFILTIATAFMGYKKTNSPKSYNLRKNLKINSDVKCDYSSYKRNSIYPPLRGGHIYINTYLIRDINKDISPSRMGGVSKYNKPPEGGHIKLSCPSFGEGKRYIHTKNMQDITNPEIIFKQLGINLQDWWDNLDNHDTRLLINKSLKNKSGIYIIINKITLNTYVGSASTNRFYTRFSNHFYHKNNGSKLVKKAINKYGLNNFIFGILEYYPNNIDKQFHINKINNKELLALETSYISLIMPKYNILTEAGNSFGYKHTEENMAPFGGPIKMKLSFTEERKQLLKKLQERRKDQWSEDSKLKWKNIALNRSKDYISLETREKISLKFSNPLYLYDINNQYICEFKNINKIANYLCCSSKTIQRSLDSGWIYIPNLFIPYLSNNLINKFNNVKDNNLDLHNIKIKSGLVNKLGYTKFYILRYPLLQGE